MKTIEIGEATHPLSDYVPRVHSEHLGGAREYYQRALTIEESLFPKAPYPQGHPFLAKSLNNLGHLLEDNGQLIAALPLLQRAVDMYQDETELFQGAVSEAESYDYLASLPGTINDLLSVACRLPDQAEATYARVWRGKAAVARAIQHRQAALTLQAGSDARARQKLESWRDVRRQLARLMLATAGGRADPGRVGRLRQLTAEKERLARAGRGAPRVRPPASPDAQPAHPVAGTASWRHGRPRSRRLPPRRA